MSNTVVVHKGRTNTITLSLGLDVSSDTITSQIRSSADIGAPLIAEWGVTFATDGTDGELILTLDDSVTSAIEASKGYMDVKRVSGAEPLAVFDRALEVEFRGSVTE